MYGKSDANLKNHSLRGGFLGQNIAFVIEEKNELLAKESGGFLWCFVGLFPTEELFGDEIVLDLIADGEHSSGDFVIDAFNLGSFL